MLVAMFSRGRVGLGMLVTGLVMGLLEIIGFLQVRPSPASVALATAGIVGAVMWPVGGVVMMRRSGSKAVVLAGLGLLILVHVVQVAIPPTGESPPPLFLAFLAACFASAAVAR